MGWHRSHSLALALMLACLASGVATAAPELPRDADAVETERVFDHAMEALVRGDPREAVRLLRSILAADPSLVRVRLELARALYLAQDWDDARAEFLVVLSGDVPDTVRRNVLRFVRAIDARRSFDWSFDIGVDYAPGDGRKFDSDTVVLNFFGQPLPFTVDRSEDEADFGVSVSAGAEYRQPVGAFIDGAPIAAYASIQGITELPDGNPADIEEAFAQAAFGMRVAYPRSTAAAALRPIVQIDNGELFEYGVLGDLTYSERFASGYSYTIGTSVGRIENRALIDRSGIDASVTAGISRTFGGRGAAGLSVRARRRFADEAPLSYSVVRLTSSLAYDLGYGAAVRFAPFAELYSEDDPVALFVERRQEWELGADLRLTKSDLFLLGEFNPYVEVGASRRWSSIDAFGYREIRFGAGFVNAF